jgi:hypothetical protein
MTQSRRAGSGAPNLDRTLLVTLLVVTVAVVAVYVALVAAGDPVLPPPFNLMIFIGLATGIIVLVARIVAMDVVESIDKIDRRTRMQSGELPLMYHPSPGPRDEDVLPSPATVAAMRRLARRVTDD